jgi:DNA-binding Lrp family transcriptional regulator
MLDDIDQRLIRLLRHDARRGISDLAGELGLARATVRARLERLEKSGEILGYTVILRAETIEMPVRGLTLIAVEGRAAQRIVEALSGFAEVTAVHTTNGRWDLIAEIGAESLSALNEVLGRIRMLPGVANSETNLLLATPRSTRARI